MSACKGVGNRKGDMAMSLFWRCGFESKNL